MTIREEEDNSFRKKENATRREKKRDNLFCTLLGERMFLLHSRKVELELNLLILITIMHVIFSFSLIFPTMIPIIDTLSFIFYLHLIKISINEGQYTKVQPIV